MPLHIIVPDIHHQMAADLALQILAFLFIKKHSQEYLEVTGTNADVSEDVWIVS